jgi:signal peptidase I
MDLKSSLTKKRIVVIAAVVLILASTAVFFYNFNGKSFDLNDRETRIIVTGSMAKNTPSDVEIGALPTNCIVMIEKLDQNELNSIKVGDVISFNYSGRLTVHRVVDITTDSSGTPTQFKTLGDTYRNSGVPDSSNTHCETISPEDVTGKVVGVSPTLGSIVHFAQTKVALLALMVVVIIVMITVVFDIVKIRRENGPGED